MPAYCLLVDPFELIWDHSWLVTTNVETGLGHPGQTRFKNYPGLTRIGSREPRNKESTIWKQSDGFRCNVRFVRVVHMLVYKDKIFFRPKDKILRQSFL